MATLRGEDIFGTHPLDLLSRTSNSELGTIGNYGSEAYIRFYNSNNPNSGHIFGINASNQLFASNISGAPAVFRTDQLAVGTVATLPGQCNIYMTGVNLIGLCNIQLNGTVLDADGNQIQLGGGGGYAQSVEYNMYAPNSETIRIIQTNDATRDNRVLFAPYTMAGRFFLNASVPYSNIDYIVPITSTNWATVNIYNGSVASFVAGTATLLQSIPIISTATTSNATEYFNFNTYVDSLSGLPEAQNFVIALEGVGHRLRFTAAATKVRAIPVQTSTGLGASSGDSTLITRNIQLNPVRSVVAVGAGESSNVFSLRYPGNFVAHASNMDIHINGVKYVYRDSNNRDYDATYNYDSINNETVFAITLDTPATAGDVVEIAVWPTATSSNYFASGNFYQAVNMTSTPWLNVVGGGVRYGNRVIVDGDLIVQGNIIGGSNTAGFISGVQLDARTLANMSCNVIGTENIIASAVTTAKIAAGAVTPAKLDLSTGGNIGIGTTGPRARLDIVENSSTSPSLLIDQLGTADILQVRDAGATKLVVNANGNVGVGTTTVRQAMDIVGNTIVTGNVGIGTTLARDSLCINGKVMVGARASSNQFPLVSLEYAGVGTGSNVLEVHGVAASSNGYNLIAAGHGATTSFVVQGDGNVGIGTTTPQAQLHVNTSLKAPGGILTSSNFYFEVGGSTLTFSSSYSSYYVVSNVLTACFQGIIGSFSGIGSVYIQCPIFPAINTNTVALGSWSTTKYSGVFKVLVQNAASGLLALERTGSVNNQVRLESDVAVGEKWNISFQYVVL